MKKRGEKIMFIKFQLTNIVNNSRNYLFND